MPRKLLFAHLVLLFLFGIRLYLFSAFYPQLATNQEVIFTTAILSQPSEFSNYNMLTANYGNLFSKKIVTVIYSKNISLNYGQVVRISGRINNRVINTNQIRSTIYFAKIEAISENANFVLAVSNFIRQNAKKIFQKYLSPKETGLLLGIILGEKTTFSKDFLHSLQVAGVMHVIAASGMNVSLVAGFLFWMFSSFLSRKAAVLLTLLGIVFYAVLSGLAASIIRATLMGVAALLAQLWGRQYSSLWGIVLAVFIMIFVNPNFIQDVGFQLSVLATIGIFGIKPLFPKHIFFEDIETTISAQIATLPILLSNFGNFGLLSILANALVLWTIPILMILGCLSVAVGLLILPLGSLLTFIAKPFLLFFIFIVENVAAVSPLVSVGTLPQILIVGYYLLLFATMLLLNKKPKLINQDTGM